MRFITNRSSVQLIPRTFSGAGKLIAFAAPETGVGKSVSAACLAMCLAKRWKCLALDLDTVTFRFRVYVSSTKSGRAPSRFMDFSDALPNSRQAGTEIPNLSWVDWTPPPGIEGFWEASRLDSLRSSIISHTAECVLVSLAPGMTAETMNFLSFADIPIVVTSPAPSVLNRSLESLAQSMGRDSNSKTVFYILNRIQRGGEVREATELIDKARSELGLPVQVLGAVQYDPELEKTFRPGLPMSAAFAQDVASRTFEDIAFSLERLLPGEHPAFNHTVVPTPPEPPAAAVLPAVEVSGTESKTRLRLAAKSVILHLDLATAETESIIASLQAELRSRNERIKELEFRVQDDERVISKLRKELADNSRVVRDIYQHLQKYTLRADDTA